MTKENLWVYVLSLLMNGPEYAYVVPDAIEEKFDWRPARITGYIVLRSLEKRGYVEATERKGETGKMRKYYRMTEKGIELLEQAKDFIEAMHAKLFGGRI